MLSIEKDRTLQLEYINNNTIFTLTLYCYPDTLNDWKEK